MGLKLGPKYIEPSEARSVVTGSVVKRVSIPASATDSIFSEPLFILILGDHLLELVDDSTKSGQGSPLTVIDILILPMESGGIFDPSFITSTKGRVMVGILLLLTVLTHGDGKNAGFRMVPNLKGKATGARHGQNSGLRVKLTRVVYHN